MRGGGRKDWELWDAVGASREMAEEAWVGRFSGFVLWIPWVGCSLRPRSAPALPSFTPRTAPFILEAAPLPCPPLPLYLLGNSSPAIPFDDFSLAATKKCSYQQTDGG